MIFALPSHRQRVHVARTITAAVCAAFVTACGEDSATAATPKPPAAILVLDGFIQPGLTSVGDTGTATTKIALGATTEFDAGGFSFQSDTALAVSSRAAGDVLYIVDVKSSVVKKVQMPTKSNPSRARLLKGSGGQSLIGVALRDSNAVALVTVSASGTSSITRIANAGTCPTDVFQYDNATWVVDANANCKVDYKVQGDVRLIRIPTTGTTRDTITMPTMRGSGASAIVLGDVAYISAGGDASFASFPYTLISSGVVTKVDLKNRRVLSQKNMPTNTYGAGTKLGLDGFLYVSLYENLTTFKSRIAKLRADDLTFVGATTTSWLTLTGTAGADVSCASGVADALGRLHCIVNGTGSVTSLVVFNAGGTEIRRVLAGQGGVDIALR